MAAAIREGLSLDAVIIGGTAEEYWSLDEYHGTDLDLCASVGPEHRKTLKSLGFDRARRHWEHAAAGVAVEFPESEVDGDMARTVEVKVARSIVRIIGVEDLYVDRVRQATADENDYGRFESALAIAVAQYEAIDWRYVRRRLRDLGKVSPILAASCRLIDSRVRRGARRQLTR